jgi:hypothetical protein
MNNINNLISSVKPTTLKLFFLAVSLILIVVLGVAQALAKATTYNQNVQVPIDLLVFVPCAAQGAGELVQLSGPLHILFTTTIDDRGGFHSKFHNQPQGVSGTGLTTGASYNATGVTQGNFNGKVGYETTFVNNFKIVGQGPGNNFMIHETFHVTVNANGTLTAFVDQTSIVCNIPSYPNSYPNYP